MVVASVHGAVGAEKIQVLVSFLVPDGDSGSPHEPFVGIQEAKQSDETGVYVFLVIFPYGTPIELKRRIHGNIVL